MSCHNLLKCISIIALLFCSRVSYADEKPIVPAKVSLGRPTSFEKDILPIFKANCLACHSKAKNEGSLILEDYKSLMKGGDSGEEIVPGKPDESYLYQVSARIEESFMPPLPNPSAAKALTPEQLGILRLWIEEGAKSSGIEEEKRIVWQPIPDGLKSIYSASLSPWSQYVAVGRTNRVFIYDLVTGKLVGQLNDPLLADLKIGNALFYPNGATQRDFVNSIAINPDGQMIATGGFRNIKLWKKTYADAKVKIALPNPALLTAVSQSTPVIATASKGGLISIWNSDDGKKITEIKGLKNEARALVLSIDGKKIGVATEADELKVYQVADGKELVSLKSPSKVNALVFDKDASQLISAHEDGVIRVWGEAKSKKNELLFDFKGYSKPVKSLLLSNDGLKLFSSGDEEYARSWDLKTKKQLRAYKHGSAISAISISPDDQKLVTVSPTGIGKIWQIKDGKILTEFKGDIKKQREALVATDENVIAKQKVALANTALKAGEAKVKGREAEFKKLTEELAAAKKALPEAKKKLDEAEQKKTLALAELAKVISDHKKKGETALANAKSQKLVADKAVVTATGAMKTVDASNAKAVAAITVAIVESEKKLAASKAQKIDEKDKAAVKKKQDATTAATNELKLNQGKLVEAKAKLNADRKKTAAELVKQKGLSLKAKTALNAATKLIATKPNTSAATKTVKTTEAEFTKQSTAYKKAEKLIVSLDRAIKASTKTLANNKKRLELLKKEKGLADSHYASTQKMHAQATKGQAVLPALKNVVFSKNGLNVITTDGSNQVRVWDAATGKALEARSISESNIVSFTMGRDGICIAALENQSIEMISLNSSWELVSRFGVKPNDPLNVSSSPLVSRVQTLDFSPDGKLLAAGTGEPSRNGSILIWDVETGKLSKQIAEAHSDTISDLKFSQDGTKLVSGAADKLAKVFDVSSGKQLASFEGHTHHVLGVSWKADGSKVATSGADNAIKTWNVSSGEVERTIAGYTKQVPSVTFIGTGDNLLSGSGDKNVRLHLSTNGRLLRSFGGSTDYIYCVDSSRDGKTVVAGGADGVLRVWDGSNGKLLFSFFPPETKKVKTASK